MPIQVELSSPAIRSLKKLPRQIAKTIQSQIALLEENPDLGKPLRHEFSHLRSYHIKLSNVSYRIVYYLDRKQQKIVIIHASSRENFYKELKRIIF